MADPYEGIGVPVDPYAGIGVAHPDHSTIGESVRHLHGAAMVSPGNAPPAAAPSSEPAPLPWSDLPGNIIPSVKAAAGNMWHAISHPIDTATSVGKLAQSALAQGIDPETAAATNMQRIVNPEGARASEGARNAYAQENVAPINAFASNLGERYGSPVRVRNTIIGDPAGFALDASLLAPGIGEFTGAPKIASTVGRVLDPLTTAGNVVAKSAKLAEPIASNALGITTGAGTDSVRAAGRAGLEGGDVAKAFTENMRGAPTQEIVDRAKDAVAQIRQERGEAYRAGMTGVGKDLQPLDFQPIEDAVNKASEVGTFKGVTVEPAAVETVDKMRAIVDEWKGLDPAEYHTPLGIDALKRSLGNIRDSTPFYSPERTAADRLYNGVRAELTKAAPDYSDVMEGYAKASDKLKEATGTFSLGEKATGDTAARKLLSSMRNNVQTNFGERARILGQLAEKDPTLPYAIAGQGFNTLAPRGLLGRVSLPFMAAGVATHPAALPLLAASMPRVVGEGAYLAGRSAAGLKGAGTPIRAAEQGAYRSGNTDQSNGAMAMAFRRANERRSNALAKRK